MDEVVRLAGVAEAKDAPRATRKLPVDARPTGKLRWLNEGGDARLQQEWSDARGTVWVDVPLVTAS